MTLPNGERLAIPSNVRIIFEVETLKYATLATVSRCGIVYISSTDLGYEPVLKSWVVCRNTELNRREEFEKINPLFTKYFLNMKIVESLRKAVKAPAMDISEIMQIT